MIFLNSYEIVDRILKTSKKEEGCLLRFDENKTFNKQLSTFTPSSFVSLVDRVLASGLELLGGHTDVGISKMINVKEQVNAWLSRSREAVGFKNLYSIFFLKVKPPRGLFNLFSSGLVFVPGVYDPLEKIAVDFTAQPKKRKEKLTNISAKYNLRWYGDVTQPVVFRFSTLSENSFEQFAKDLDKFFEEVDFAEV
jgi:hypothetical protein